MSTTGVTYYKLENGYPGDVTKGCGLSGSEIDKNFHFLRGYDIKAGEVLPSGGTIVFTRVNGEEMRVSGLEEYVNSVADGVKISEEDSYFDKDRLELHIALKYDDGTTSDFVIGGLKVEHDRIYVGYGLSGDGRITNPISLNPVYKTGFFEAAKEIIDCTEPGNTLPENKTDGDRYVTKERISKLGLEYNTVALNDLMDRLEEGGSGWRIPTADDWNGLLNGAELDCDDMVHGDSTNSGYYGKNAGFVLKDDSWAEPDHEKNGFGIAPTEETSIGLKSKFWSSTTDKIKEITQKVFTQNDGRVYQKGGDNQNDQFASIRLVRDYDGWPVVDSEEIDGVIYDCKSFPSILNGVETRKVWTLQNASFSRYVQDGTARIPEISGEEDEGYAYFLNEYNKELDIWLKKKLLTGDVVVIGDDEYILSEDGELVNRTEKMANEVLGAVTDRIDSVEDAISAETAQRESDVESIRSAITEITEAINETNENLSAETAARINGDLDFDALASEVINAVGGVAFKNVGGDKVANVSFDGDFSKFNPNNQEGGWSLS